MNNSSSSVSDPQDGSWWNVLVLIVFLVATLTVLVGYCIVVKVFIKYRKIDFKNQFYILAVNLAIADCISLCYFAIALFLALFGRASWTMLAWHQPILAAYFTGATMTFAIGINR